MRVSNIMVYGGHTGENPMSSEEDGSSILLRGHWNISWMTVTDHYI
jgi:hypothetical protein